jgi:hypothetical protein
MINQKGKPHYVISRRIGVARSTPLLGIGGELSADRSMNSQRLSRSMANANNGPLTSASPVSLSMT